MLTRVQIKSFGNVVDLSLEPLRTNVLVGEGDKAQVLLLLFAMLDAISPPINSLARRHPPTKHAVAQRLRIALYEMFQVPPHLGRLTSPGAERTEICLELEVEEGRLTHTFAFQWGAQAQHRPVITDLPPWRSASQVFIPQQDLLSIFPGFVSLYETRQVSFSAAWHRACLQLGAQDTGQGGEVADWLEESLGFKINLHINDDGGAFVVEDSKGKRRPVTLYPIGHRKLLTVLRLLRNGQLREGSILFWDEPTAAQPLRFKELTARLIGYLGGMGVQVIAATNETGWVEHIPHRKDT